MIAKVTRGRGFSGLMSYLLTGSDGKQPERVAWTASRNLFTDSAALVPPVMHATAAKSAQVEKPVYHLTISLDPEEKLGRQALERVVDTTLSDLGLDQHQAFLVAHSDTRHEHVHVMVNRVHPESGRAWNGAHDYARIEKSLRHQEQALGLRQVPGRHFALAHQKRHRGGGRSSGDRRLEKRTGKRPFAELVRDVARSDLLEARSWEELHRWLGELGLRLEKRGRGLAVTDGARRIKASFIDRKASLGGLEKRLGPYEPAAREFPAGKSRRWQQLQALRRTVEELALLDESRRFESAERWQQHAGERQSRRLERRFEVLDETLDRRLAEVYRDPRSARRALDQLVRRHGAEQAAERLARAPEKIAPLRGRGGPFGSADRWAAVEAAREASVAVRDAFHAKAALHGARRRVARQVSARTVRPPRPKRRGRVSLEKVAVRLLAKVGWRLAAKVLTPPQLQLLRLTARLGGKILDASLGRGRGGRA